MARCQSNVSSDNHGNRGRYFFGRKFCEDSRNVDLDIAKFLKAQIKELRNLWFDTSCPCSDCHHWHEREDNNNSRFGEQEPRKTHSHRLGIPLIVYLSWVQSIGLILSKIMSDTALFVKAKQHLIIP